MERNIEKTSLHFIRDESPGVPEINYSGFDESQSYSDDYIYRDTDIINARGLKENSEFSLDVQAFKMVEFTPDDVDYSDPEKVKKEYYPSVEELVKKQTGASDVFAFDHTVRRGIKNSNRRPAYHVHNDYTYETGFIRAESELGDEIMQRFAGKRMIQINVWRSIAGVVEQDPLTLMDATTLDKRDLVKTRINFNDMNTGKTHHGEIFAVKKNDNQRWYYYPEMDSQEAILIKGYDTDESKSSFAMHSAFPLASQGEHNKPRQSIETRTYAFYD